MALQAASWAGSQPRPCAIPVSRDNCTCKFCACTCKGSIACAITDGEEGTLYFIYPSAAEQAPALALSWVELCGGLAPGPWVDLVGVQVLLQKRMALLEVLSHILQPWPDASGTETSPGCLLGMAC